jgi:hypothetical protein
MLTTVSTDAEAGTLIAPRQIILNPAVDCDSTAGFAASYNHIEQLRPVRDAAAGRVGGPSDNFERFTQDPIPPLHRIQLLRSLSQLSQERAMRR